MTVDNRVRHTQCPLCASAHIAKLGDIAYPVPVPFSTHEITLTHIPEIWSCQECASRFTQNAIPESVAAELYASGIGEERWASGNIREVKHPEIVDVLDVLYTRGARVLDVGCNTGELLDFARERGCVTAGVEYARSSRDIVTGKGHSVFPSLESVDGMYDVITAFDLVEHLYDVPAFLGFCRRRLAPEGRLALLTGDIGSPSARLAGVRWWYYRFPEHIAFPSRRYLAGRPGFPLERWVRTYAARAFEPSHLAAWAGFALGISLRRYRAQPPLGPDHVLAVLKT